MKMRKLIFFVLIKGYVKVDNMYFLIAKSYEIHITKSYDEIYYSLKL